MLIISSITKLRSFLSTLTLAISLVMFGSCSQTRTDVGPGTAIPASTGASSHTLAPTELVEIKVFQEPDLTTSARISEDGRITMPMIGELPIAGLSIPDAARLIRGRLEAHFVVNPQVTLTVVERARKLFTILGQVNRAGTYRFPDHEAINLIQAIGIAGGYTPIGDPTRITLKRAVAGKSTVLKLDAKRMAKDSSTPLEIQSGDIITVGERLF